MNSWGIGLVFGSILVAVVVVLLSRWRVSRTMGRIERMLDAAQEGHYSEELFDESRLSMLETRFADYLSSSSISTEQLREEKEKIKMMISDISHQTKTPIANLLLYSELMMEQDLPKQIQSEVQAIQTQAEKLRFLIDALVKLSRLESGVVSLAPHRQPVQPMLDQVLESYRDRAQKKGLELHNTPTTISASFDSKWTVEALGNLVDNAIKYTPEGRVAVQVEEYEIFVKIDVADTGIGISEEEQPKVFSRFYRAQSVQQNEGVGIGLYLAREIISGEGGYIRLSAAEPKGSVFSVFLPK